jgi:hypothetical protein
MRTIRRRETSLRCVRARVYAATTLSLHPVGKVRPPPPGPFLSIPPSRGEQSASSSPPSPSPFISIPPSRGEWFALSPPPPPSPFLPVGRTIQRESTLARHDTCAPRIVALFIEFWVLDEIGFSNRNRAVSAFLLGNRSGSEIV